MRPLTSLRFFAAMLVFVDHQVPLTDGFSFGYAGVSFFFVLSGFILTYTYRDFARRPLLDSLRTFYVARLARVYPLHLVCMVLALAVISVLGGPFWTDQSIGTRATGAFAQGLLVQSWFPQKSVHYALNSPSWSISDEAFFYLLFPAIVYGLARTLRGRDEKIVLAFAAVASTVPAIALYDVHVSSWWIYIFPPTRLADFVIGIVLGLAFLRRANCWPRVLRPTSYELLAIGAVIISPALVIMSPESLRLSAVFLPIWSVLIYVFAQQRGAISRALSTGPFVRLGEISFAFYLIHLSVIAVVGRLNIAPPMSFALALGGSLALSFVLYHFVEEPLRVRIRRALARSTRPAQAAT